MADNNVEDSAVNDFLLILEEHRKNCERQGKYVEAEIAKNRLEELKVHEENRRKEAMRSRQIAERLGVEEAHMLEFQQFNQVWDRKMEEYERNVEELVVNMRVCVVHIACRAMACVVMPMVCIIVLTLAQEKHKAELLEFQQRQLEKQQKPKYSKDLLNLRRIEEHLARQKECVVAVLALVELVLLCLLTCLYTVLCVNSYAEAHKIKLKSDALVRSRLLFVSCLFVCLTCLLVEKLLTCVFVACVCRRRGSSRSGATSSSRRCSSAR